MTGFVIFCVDCPISPCKSGHNQFTKTKFNRPISKTSKSSYYIGIGTKKSLAKAEATYVRSPVGDGPVLDLGDDALRLDVLQDVGGDDVHVALLRRRDGLRHLVQSS